MSKRTRRATTALLLAWSLFAFCVPTQGVGLSGSLDAFLRLEGPAVGSSDPPPLALSEHRMILGADLDAGCFDAGLRAIWDMGVFDDLEFRSQLALGDWGIRTRVQFSPEDEGFHAARFDVRGTVGDLSFGNLVALYADEDASYDEVTFRGTVEDVAVDFRVRTSLCPTTSFDSAILRANWVGTSCRIPMDIRFRFDATRGFDSFTYRMRDIPLPLLWGDRTELTGRLWIELKEDSKRVLPSLDLVVEPACFSIVPYISITAGDAGWSIESVDLEGYELIAELGDVFVLTLATSFVESANRRIVGERDFFEKIELSGPLAGCCGETGDWDVSLYFLRPEETDTAFSWGRFAARADLPIGGSFEIGLETVFDAAPADPAWQIGVRLALEY